MNYIHLYLMNNAKKLINSKWSEKDYIGLKADDNQKIIGFILPILSKEFSSYTTQLQEVYIEWFGVHL